MFNVIAVFSLWPKEMTLNMARKVTASLLTKTAPVVTCDPCAEARAGNQPLFDYFSNLAFRKAKAKNDAAWFEFDLAAFVEALKSPHRYLQDTVKRKEECERLEKRLEAMRGGGEDESGENDDESSDSLSGFKGDYRIGMDTTQPDKKGVWQLIHDKDLLAYNEEDDTSETGEEEPDSMKCSLCGGACQGYGISENTVRGWRELRQKWREAAAKSEFTGETNKENFLNELARIRRDEQGDRPEESGSGPLFKRLELPEYHCIWNDPPPNPDVHWEDPLWAWVIYRERQDELEKTKRPIRFTPAHATDSPRFFTFPKQSRKKSKAPARGKATAGTKTDHLPGMFAFNDEGKLVEDQG